MATIIRLPMLAAGEETAVLTAWLAEPGAEVGPDQPLVEIETEKASVEYEPEEPGIFAGALAPLGEAVPVGAPIAALAAAGESLDDALAAGKAEVAAEGGEAPAGEETSATPENSESAASAAQADAAAAASIDGAAAHFDTNAGANATDGASITGATSEAGVSTGAAVTSGASAVTHEGGRIFASPIVRKLAKEHNVNVANLSGTGPDGRIVRRDLEAYLAAAPAQAAEPPTASSTSATPTNEVAADTTAGAAHSTSHGAATSTSSASHNANATGNTESANTSELVPLSGMRKAIARRLTESKSTVPHFYISADVRMDAALELRKQLNAVAPTKISVNDLVIKAVAGALRKVPRANAIWRGDAIEYFTHADISVAVSVEGGLVTPVLRNVDSLGIAAVSEKMKDFAARGRDGKLKQDEIVGGSFSISNLGMYGTQQFNAILNPPQSAILAVGAASKRPVVNNAGELAVATVMTVTLSADHRVIDGALAAEWINAFKELMENPLGIVM
ncbi:MAG: 2-oxo acid dehydrogenase subunit E2 [Arcanobacterium sp.]|nr:2-oxo acid dehydrogenase subunit E2 [Arcanobacterium sp.]